MGIIFINMCREVYQCHVTEVEAYAWKRNREVLRTYKEAWKKTRKRKKKELVNPIGIVHTV